MGAAGGWLGFRSADAGLRQHRWGAAQILSGNFGGHFGPTSAGFLREAVLPAVAGDGGAAVVTESRPGLRGRIAAALRR